MRFAKPGQIFLFGGADALVGVARYIKGHIDLPLAVYTCARQLSEPLAEGGTLKSALEDENISFQATEDINTCPGFIERITPHSLGIGFGEAWSFSKEIIEAFSGNLLDLMGIRLPRYRGGAHYSWQILTGNRMGACNLQVINEEMIQGRLDSGEIIKFKEYLFPATARIPRDYFTHAVEQEINFVAEFLGEVMSAQEFAPFSLQNNFSLFMPRLNTVQQGYIDWSWSGREIDHFICAFDEPYAGAGTFIDRRLVRLKSSRLETNDGLFHPFQSGLVYKKYNDAIYIATISGTVVVQSVYDEQGNNVIPDIMEGQRFYTPQVQLEHAMLYNAEYTTSGLKE